jgi:uncharacterized protein (DUF58 family)
MVAGNTLTGTHVDLNDLLAMRFQKPNPNAAKSRVVGNRAGAKLSHLKGRGVDLAEVRAYQPGDDVRAIDWHVTARTNKVHTKIFREERERPTLVVVDQTQNMFFGSKLRLKSVAAAEIATRIAWHSLLAGDRVGGVVVTNNDIHVHRPYRTNKSVARFLNDLAEANQALNRATQPQLGILDVMLRIRRLARHNFRIAIVSDFSGDPALWQDHLQGIARSNQLLAVHVYDPMEEFLPPSDYYLVSHGKERVSFFSGDPTVRDRYQARFQDHSDALARTCQHSHMQYQRVATVDENLNLESWQ